MLLAALLVALTGCSGTPSTLPEPPASRPTYSLTLSLGPHRTVVHGTETVAFEPEVATDRIVFRLWPNAPAQRRLGARLTVTRVRVDGRATGASNPDPTTLVLAHALAAGERVRVVLTWTLQLPRQPTERLASEAGVRLSSFFPLLAWTGSGWALDPPAQQGETWTSPTADFDVVLKPPKGFSVFATGARAGRNRWHATAVRDFALEISRFKITRRTVDAPAPVAVNVASEDGVADLTPYLDGATRALTTYAKRYGPYPWSTFTVVVETDHEGVGLEYPTLVFMAPNVPPEIVEHEAAHQWFYSLVGNDQARDPWLDESLAQWSAARLDGTVATQAAIDPPPNVRNHLGEPMAFWGSLPFFPDVFDGLYAQGVRALAALGDDDAVDCALRSYVHANAYRTAVPGDLLTALTPAFPNAGAVLRGFGVGF